MATAEQLAGKYRVPAIKYSWQQLVLDALRETERIKLPGKINAAERAIAQRTSVLKLQDLEEQAAIKGALRILRILIDEQKPSAKPDEKKETA